MPDASHEPPLYLDACVAIKLLASGAAQEILSAVPFRTWVTREVHDKEVSVAPPLSEEEAETFVDLAMDLDDGEAETAAAALHRGASIATDDRKAIKVLTTRHAGTTIVRTSALLRAWAESQSIDEARVRQCLIDIQQFASFIPPRDDPDRAWWLGVVHGGRDG